MTAHPPPTSYLKPAGAGDESDMFHPSYLDEIDNACRGPAVQMAIDMRIEQIVRYGHDAEHDSMQAIDRIPQLARERLIAAIEQISGTGERRHLPAAVKNLARTSAMCCAAIDRLLPVIEAETKREEKQGGLL